MVDTVRSLSTLQTLLADNTAGDISAQDVRDLLVSVYGIHLIETVTLASAGHITFSSIPAYWKDLLVTGDVRSAVAATVDTMLIQVGNGSLDTGNNYAYLLGRHDDAGATSSPSGAGVSAIAAPTMVGNTGTANYASPIKLRFYDYTRTGGFFRNVDIRIDNPDNPAEAERVSVGTGVWLNTADAIDTIALSAQDATSDNLLAGSTASLWGLGC